jgi:hypothetical protein
MGVRTSHQCPKGFLVSLQHSFWQAFQEQGEGKCQFLSQVRVLFQLKRLKCAVVVIKIQVGRRRTRIGICSAIGTGTVKGSTLESFRNFDEKLGTRNVSSVLFSGCFSRPKGEKV